MGKSIILAALLFGTAAIADEAKPKPPSTDDAMVVHLGAAKWMPTTTPGMPPGAEGAPIGVDPKTGGPTGYARFPAGFRVPMHWHTWSETTVMLSGKATFVLDGKSHRIEAGSIFFIPPKTHHELTCDAGAPCVLVTRRAGPADYNLVTPAK